MGERKPFLLRVDRELLEAMHRWANDDLRSLNAQIEFVLRRGLQQAGREASVPRPGRSSAPTAGGAGLGGQAGGEERDAWDPDATGG